MAKTNKPMPSTVTSEMKKRCFGAVALFLIIGFGLVIYRLYDLQIVNYKEYQADAARQQYSDTTLTAARGSILDATGKVLARSSTLYNITADPALCNQDVMPKVSRDLAAILDVEAESLYEKLSDENAQYKVLAKRVSKPVADEVMAYVRELNATDRKKTQLSVATEQVSTREYPYGAFMASVLGFCNDDGQGFYGLEKYYNEELAGVDGRSIAVTNAHGYDLGEASEQYHEPQDGESLVLTIDVNLQEIAERYLTSALESNNVQNRGCVIIMDVNTGGILAMATKPDFDPNRPYEIYDEGYKAQLEEAETDEDYNALSKKFRETQWKNKAITELYYPGSVFKLITASSAMDSGIMNENSTFTCGGELHVGTWTYTCAASTDNGYTTSHGAQVMADGLQNSCNIYFIQAGQAMGANRFYDYFNAYGFTKTTGIDLPSETPYLLYYKPQNMGPAELASSSFGQAQKITPMQMVTAASAVVNGGYLVTPHVVDHILDADGNTIKTVETNIKRQVISEQVSEKMRSMMEYVVGHGQDGFSGRNAYVAGYRIGGKSGTSEQLDMDVRWYDGDYRKVSSFLAALPIDDPQIVVFAMLDDPQGANDYASVIAAPVVGNIISEAAPYLGLATDGTEPEGMVKIPDQVGKNWTLAQVAMNKIGFKHRLIGGVGEVTYQYPLAYSMAPAGSTIYFYTSATESLQTAVPDVTGKTVEQATQMLRAANLNLLVNGSGKVVSQDISAGSQVNLGTIITLDAVRDSADGSPPEDGEEPDAEAPPEEPAEG